VSSADKTSDRAADRHRLDKWLWCTRFYKSRALATQAVAGGKIKVNGERVKPAHDIRAGDRLTLQIQEESIDVEVLSFPARRGPASEAQTSYAQTAASRERSIVFREQLRVANLSRPRPDTKPDKRQRRQLEKLRRGQVTE
jgi:ribosome-associated heat shock protein Hsp15